ncbi:ABC transporter ATP-binding protein [Demequina mangrovi]|uniref:Amino acid/amide ABC transporter ATP-binding protein 1, HAAT family n=1 Tax=Demequina mangrovi TaxID=1043493 RepID=A0A1H6TIP8_9MICO|nr:ABC transporter ATP-binding protein [Demequina mangrovi]SEI79939.1 amino acid/amide ABC transporter ATP-binding protein 1, HAAT family [Demequina mangrovi]
MPDTTVLDGVAHEPGVAKPDPILVADGIVRRFGGLTAVNVDHFEVQRNTITALIGPNGAGKSTFFNLLTSFDTAQEGAGTFDGMPLRKVAPHKVARKGMVRTFQLTKALEGMSVMENMRLGAQEQPGESLLKAFVPPLWSKREQEVTEQAHELLHRFKLYEKRDDSAGSLSGGQRKLLEMARALMSNPTMVMLDEPMAGVNPALTESLLEHIVELKNEGMTVLFVEHDMHMVRRISDWVAVMAQGQLIAEGPAGTVMQNKAVQDAYLGEHHDTDLSEDN